MTIDHIDHIERVSKFLPPVVAPDPSSTHAGTTPGSFSQAAQIAPGRNGAMTYSSPDTPGMPGPSDKTAWDFMPQGWVLKSGYETNYEKAEAWQPPAGFTPVTQLESARCGIVTPEMQRVAECETHLTAEQIRDESQPAEW
ncbi:MAG: hypothetical protein R3C20_25950 [Planctomycetaceae bacterium]